MKTIAPTLFERSFHAELRRCIAAPPRPWRTLPILLLALAPACTSFGQMTLLYFKVGEGTEATASDIIIGTDAPPVRDVNWTTNAFSMLQTNAASSASVGVAEASASAASIGRVEPLSISATGSVNAAASSTTNRIDFGSAGARAWFSFRFALPCTHEYRLETFLGGTPGSPFNYLSFDGPSLSLLWTLPPDSGVATNSGRLAPGTYDLVADFGVGVTASSGEMANSAADYWLRLQIAPIQPTLAIRRSGPDVVLSWTTNAAGSVLFHTTSVVSTNWQVTTLSPVIVGDQYTVTEPATEQQRFYRLVVGP